MKKTILALLSLFIGLASFAKQTNGTIKGTVNDNNGKPRSAATIILQKAKDSSLVKTEVSDENGKFEFINIAPGSYLVSITSVGYNKYQSAVFAIAEGQVQELSPASLLSTPKELKGVVVTSKKPLVEVKADKVILNVESSINSTGSNALELLKKSPGVVVDKDDNISLKGKNGVQIFIDGRPSQMAGTDLAALLKSMNSADIESIEMISNPSAKYEASGNAGIINIKLKKDKRFGINGNISTGLAYGKTLKNNNSVSLNYRNKVANWFGNYSNRFGTDENNIDLYRIQNDSIYDQKSTMPSSNNNHNFKAGVDLALDKKNTLGFIVNGNIGSGSFNTFGSTIISKASTGVISRILNASNTAPNDRTNLNFNTNYKFADTTGHELNIDADYGLFRRTGTSYQPNYYYSYPSNILQSQFIYKNNTPTDIDIYTLKIDYEQNFKKGKLGFGGKYSNVNTKNTFDFWDVINNQDIKNINKSNKFNYSETVNALYVNYNKQLSPKYSLQTGVRMEQTTSEGNLISATPQADDNVKRSYVDFFPSAALTFTPNQNNQFTLTYSRRIDRPSYQNLNPFENKLDELTYQKGNPFLRPQYTNSFEVSHLFKYKLNTTLGFSHISDLFSQIIDTVSNKTYVTEKNLATQNIVNLTVGTPFSFFKIWNGYFNVNTNYSKYKADIGSGRLISLDALNYTLYAQNTFSVAKGLTAELSGFFVGPGIQGGTFKSTAFGSFDIGLQKQILQNKGTLKLTLTDVAKTQVWHGTSTITSYLDIHAHNESRQLRLNFSYRFGSSTVKSARQHKSGAEEESKRLNGGGGIGGGGN